MYVSVYTFCLMCTYKTIHTLVHLPFLFAKMVKYFFCIWLNAYNLLLLLLFPSRNF